MKEFINESFSKKLDKISNIKYRYIVLLVSLIIGIDHSGKLIYYFFNATYPCYNTYISLIKGENYTQWVYYWIIVLFLRCFEFWLEYFFMLFTFGYFYYFKLFFCFLLIRNQILAETLYHVMSDYLKLLMIKIDNMKNSNFNIINYLKNIKNLNKMFSTNSSSSGVSNNSDGIRKKSL